MHKKTTFLLLMFMLAALLFSACSPKEGAEGSSQNSAGRYVDFAGKRIGVQTGEIYNIVARDLLDAGEVPEYTSMADLLESMRSGRIDAGLTDSSYIQPLIDSGTYPDYEYIWVPKEVFANESAIVFQTEQLRDRWNAWFADITADGTMDEIRQRWLGVSLPSEEDVPKFESPGENGVLKVCNTGSFPPFNYFDANGEPTGMDYELASRFAQHMGMKIELTTMEYGAIGPYVISGKADMSTCFLTVTEERRQSMIFGDPVVSTQGVLIVPKSTLTEEDGINTAAPGYADFADKKIGVTTGTIWDQLTEEQVGGIPVYYTDMSAAIEDIRKGRLDGYMVDLSEARVFTALPDKDDLQIIAIPSEVFTAPMGAISNNQDIIDRFNVFLAEIKADGTLDEMQNRWLENIPDLETPMPDIPLTGENGVLKYSASGLALPFSYVGSDNELKGYSVELAIRFAAHEGMDIEFTTVDFGGFIAYVAAGKTDIFIDAVSVTEERKESVLFSDSIYDDQAAIIALKAGGESAAESDNTDYTDFIGLRFAVKNGTIYDSISTDIFESAETLLFEDYPSIYEAVLKGRADAGMRGYYAAYVSLFEPEYSDLEIIAMPENLHNNPIGAISMDQGVVDQFNEFLSAVKADGTYDEMKERWFDTFDPGNIPDMPEIPLTGENGALTVAISSDYMPFSFLGADGVNLGFDIELAMRFAAYGNKDIEFVDMAFSGLLPYVMSGKADIAISDITITEERKQSVLFTEPYFIDMSAIIYRRDFEAPAENTGRDGFVKWLKTGIERNLITDNRWKMVVNGLGVTMIISFAAQICGTIFACFLCFVLTRKNRFIKGAGNLYCGLIHGTPIVVLLMITYYIIFGNTNISSVLVAIAAFTMVEGAIIAQNLKGAIETVDPVEIEAARSIGFSAFKAFRTVTLPQAVRRALPSYTNGFVELVKATAIVGYIAIQDLTRAGDIIRSRTYDAYFPLLFVALIYLTVTMVCIQLFKFIVKKINGGNVQ